MFLFVLLQPHVRSAQAGRPESMPHSGVRASNLSPMAVRAFAFGSSPLRQENCPHTAPQAWNIICSIGFSYQILPIEIPCHMRGFSKCCEHLSAPCVSLFGRIQQHVESTQAKRAQSTPQSGVRASCCLYFRHLCRSRAVDLPFSFAFLLLSSLRKPVQIAVRRPRTSL